MHGDGRPISGAVGPQAEDVRLSIAGHLLVLHLDRCRRGRPHCTQGAGWPCRVCVFSDNNLSAGLDVVEARGELSQAAVENLSARAPFEARFHPGC